MHVARAIALVPPALLAAAIATTTASSIELHATIRAQESRIADNHVRLSGLQRALDQQPSEVELARVRDELAGRVAVVEKLKRAQTEMPAIIEGMDRDADAADVALVEVKESGGLFELCTTTKDVVNFSNFMRRLQLRPGLEDVQMHMTARADDAWCYDTVDEVTEYATIVSGVVDNGHP